MDNNKILFTDIKMPNIQLDANRSNAKRSSGPKTEKGKQRSSRNSFKHGLTGQIHIATIDEMAAYQAFCDEYFTEWAPAGPTERGMVQTLADSQWQINRASTLSNNLHPGKNGELSVEQSQQLDRYSRHGSRHKRDFERTLKQLQAVQKDRKQRHHVNIRQAAQIQDMHFMLGEEWDPPKYGFVLTIPEILNYMRRRNMIIDAATAMQCDHDKEAFLKKQALNVV